MQIIKVEHTDFDLVIECNNLEYSFNKARKKQNLFLTSTSYSASQGSISIYDFESRLLKNFNSNKTYPLFFENKDYFFGITFKNKEAIKHPIVFSKLKDVEEKFFYRNDLGFLAGTVNFGNDIGKSNFEIRYLKDNVKAEFNFDFEVFPVKLDFKNDYEKIILDIEKEYPYLVLDFLKKTYSSFQNGNSPNTDLIWWQVFGGLYKDFIQSSKFILNKPHSRIIKEIKYVKADRIQKWSTTLEEKYAEFNQFPNKNYRTEYRTLSTNTPENRFLKHAVNETTRRYKRVKHYIENKFSKVITESFKNELASIEKQLDSIVVNPFFRKIDDFKGLKQESLVLQKATGYSTVYKSWIMLNSGLKFFEGIQQIELKNIAELYQIWTFIEIKNILQKLLGRENPDHVELAEIHIDNFIFKIERGVKSKVSFVKNNGDIIDLYHDYSYDNSENNGVKSFTVNQRPDIVLRITKNDLIENYEMTYLFDAKYRLESDGKEGSPDIPTEDSINQMHRYRDAIYYINKDKRKPEKEIIGAYILFPGDGEIEMIKEMEYYQSIESVNIGAFPLRPNDTINRSLLEDHLKTIIGLDTESILNEVSPQKFTSYEKHNPEVLIGIVRKGEQIRYFETSEKLIYHCGKLKPSKLKDENSGYIKIQNNIKFFAPYFPGKGVRDYYEIIDFEIQPRNQIYPKDHPLYKENDKSERLTITLGKKITINNGRFYTCPISVYRYTSLKNIRTPKSNNIEVFNLSGQKSL